MNTVRVIGRKGVDFRIEGKRVSHEKSIKIALTQAVRNIIKDGDLIIQDKKVKSKKGGE